MIGYIDLTTLAGDDTRGRVEALVDRALAPVPAVGSCFLPSQVFFRLEVPKEKDLFRTRRFTVAPFVCIRSEWPT